MEFRQNKESSNMGMHKASKTSQRMFNETYKRRKP